MSPNFIDYRVYSGFYINAVNLALRTHDRQLGGQTNVPFASQLLATSALVWEMGGTESQAIAALLSFAPNHLKVPVELLEQQFGKRVGDILKHLVAPIGQNPDEYIENLFSDNALADGATLVFLAETLQSLKFDLAMDGQSIYDEGDRQILPPSKIDRYLKILALFEKLRRHKRILPQSFQDELLSLTSKVVACQPYSLYVSQPGMKGRSYIIVARGQITAYEYDVCKAPRIASIADMANVDHLSWMAKSNIVLLKKLYLKDGVKSPEELFDRDVLQSFSNFPISGM